MSKSGFQVSFALMLAYVLLVYVYYTVATYGLDRSALFNPAVVTGLNSDSNYAWFFMTFYPFLVALPAGFAFTNDRRTGAMSTYISKVGRRRYYASKAISIFIVTFVAFFLPFLINMLLNMIAFPINGAAVLTGWEPMSETYIDYANQYLWPDLFFISPYLYYIAQLGFFAVFSGLVGVFIASMSLFVKKYNVMLLLPFYLILQFVVRIPQIFHGIKMNTHYEFYLLAYDSVKKNIEFIGAFIFLIILVSGLAFLFNRRDVLD
jgi:hypothetical protein